jgi:hypothetical protein
LAINKIGDNMKRIIFILILMPAMIFGQDKIPLRFPLGLYGGMPKDSVSIILKSKNIKYKGQDIIQYKMKFGILNTTDIEFAYFNEKLMKLTLISEKAYSSEGQMHNINVASDFIERTYYCTKETDNRPNVSRGIDLMNHNMIEFGNPNTICSLISSYSRYSNFYIAIFFIDRNILNSFIENQKEKNRKVENNSKKDL